MSPDETTFRCPGCTDVYQLHWQDPDQTGLCRSCGEHRDGYCKWADEHPQHLSLHPCSTSSEAPGTPCRYCAVPVPLDGGPCPGCWQSFTGMALADIKAVFAADADAAPDGAPVFDVGPGIKR